MMKTERDQEARKDENMGKKKKRGRAKYPGSLLASRRPEARKINKNLRCVKKKRRVKERPFGLPSCWWGKGRKPKKEKHREKTRTRLSAT